jgi:adenylate cyclase
MAEERVQRRLAAILAADVAGYSRLMGADEEGTLARLKILRRDLLDPKIDEHRGRIVKTTGDGLLAEFVSVVDALRCAVDVQRGMVERNADVRLDQRIEFRVGINVGDIVVESGDIYGDGVNVAARLEGLSEPGGICVSARVQEDARGKLDLTFEDIGEQRLKNIAWPVKVYRAQLGREVAASRAALACTDKPSIAVLPFINMSGDPEQEYFSDGITEDIITDLSKVSTLNVLSRHTVFTFKGKSVDIGEVARRLQVGHVVEGSVRKAGGRVRITAQLIDASNDSHVWGERYDRELSDIFALQDEISQAIVAALKIKLLPQEKKAIHARSTQNPDAYQLYLLARHHFERRDQRGLEIAIRFCRRALEIDPDYTRAWALIALCQAAEYRRGKSEESGLPAAEKALSLDPTLADAYAAKGRVLAELGRYDEALAAHEESLGLEPDSYNVRYHFGMTCFVPGRHEQAIEHFERAAQLLETDVSSLTLAALNYEALGRHGEAVGAMRRMLERVQKVVAVRPDNADLIIHGALALAYLGEKERAKEWVSRALTIEPDNPMDLYNLACALTRLGEHAQALDILENSTPKMAPQQVSWTKQDPDLLPLHDHPRFKTLIARGEARLAATQTKQEPKSD